MTPELPEPLRAQIETALFRGAKIEAIKLHREATSSGLKEAKDAVEELEARLRATSPEKFSATPARSGCGKAAAVLLFVVLSSTITAGVGLWRWLA